LFIFQLYSEFWEGKRSILKGYVELGRHGGDTLMCGEESLVIEFESSCEKVRDPMVGEMAKGCNDVSRRLQALHEARLGVFSGMKKRGVVGKR